MVPPPCRPAQPGDDMPVHESEVLSPDEDGEAAPVLAAAPVSQIEPSSSSQTSLHSMSLPRDLPLRWTVLNNQEKNDLELTSL